MANRAHTISSQPALIAMADSWSGIWVAEREVASKQGMRPAGYLRSSVVAPSGHIAVGESSPKAC